MTAARQAPAAANRAAPVTPGCPSPADERPHFATEPRCEAYLLGRFERGEVACPGCGGRQGHWIASRRVWQCRDCGRQAGLRAGTVMAGSRLPLLAWFRGVELLLKDPDASTAELVAATGIRRAGSVRRIARRIRQAMASDRAGDELAALNAVFGSGAPPVRGHARS